MPWFSGKKKTAPANDHDNSAKADDSSNGKDRQKERDVRGGKAATSTSPPPASPQTSPEKRSGVSKKSHSSSVRDREKGSGREQRPKSPRHSKSFGRTRKASEEHPLNLHPDELRRLSSRMSVPNSPGPATPVQQENGVSGEPMETTPAPESVPGGFPSTNGVNGEESGEDQAPAPPPHKSPRSPPPQKEEVDAEACKAAGNKFYKAGQYERAIAEYTKGSCGHCHSS